LTALGVDHTYEVGIVGLEEDGTTSEAEIFNACKPLKFDLTYRLYMITGVAGPYPCVQHLLIRGAFHEMRDDGVNAEDDRRTGASFGNKMHSNAFDFLMFDATPESLPGKPAATTSAFLRRIRDFKKNVKRRYIILKGHLVYLAGVRRRKNTVRDIRVRTMHPHRIVPFADEIDEVHQLDRCVHTPAETCACTNTAHALRVPHVTPTTTQILENHHKGTHDGINRMENAISAEYLIPDLRQRLVRITVVSTRVDQPETRTNIHTLICRRIVGRVPTTLTRPRIPPQRSLRPAGCNW
jgi:hypothetical protein